MHCKRWSRSLHYSTLHRGKGDGWLKGAGGRTTHGTRCRFAGFIKVLQYDRLFISLRRLRYPTSVMFYQLKLRELIKHYRTYRTAISFRFVKYHFAWYVTPFTAVKRSLNCKNGLLACQRLTAM